MRDSRTTSTDHVADHTSPVCGNVLERLASEGISPRPWWQFYVREGAVWVCWLISVVVGAAAVAVTLYVTLSVPGMLYEATNTNVVTAMIHALPWLWLVVFLGMAYLAWVNLRHTRRGYRYQALTLVASSVVLSVGLGVVLQQFGQGYVMDRTFAAWTDMYPSYEKARLTVWQAPQNGRLVGAVVSDEEKIVIDNATGTVVFQDTNGQQWQLVIPDLPTRSQALLKDVENSRLRLLGTTTAPHEFYVCGAFNWVFAPEYETYAKQLTAERLAFMEMAAWYQQMTASTTRAQCASLPVFSRVHLTPTNVE